MVELQIPQGLPEPLLIIFGVCTVTLVSVHLLALMVSTCLLPHVELAAKEMQNTSDLLPRGDTTMAASLYQEQQNHNPNHIHVRMKK